MGEAAAKEDNVVRRKQEGGGSDVNESRRVVQGGCTAAVRRMIKGKAVKFRGLCGVRKNGGTDFMNNT